MSYLEKEYYDETHVVNTIKDFLKKDLYKNVFKFLNEYFEEKNSIRTTEVRDRLCIPDRSKVCRIMDVFVVLKLLERKKQQGEKSVLFVKDETYWDVGVEFLK